VPTPLPNNDDFTNISTTVSYDGLTISTNDIMRFFSKEDSFAILDQTFHAITWSNSFGTKTFHTRRSYILMRYYYETGIPEDVDYSKMDDDIYMRRDYFYYYADIFFYDLFSSFDILGHMLNLVFRLGIKKPELDSSLKKLQVARPNLHACFIPIINSTTYKAKQIRNDFTHNVPSGVPDNRSKQIAPTTWAFGGSYHVPPSQVLSNAESSLALLKDAVAIFSSLSP
jgi:hypothetical protein